MAFAVGFPGLHKTTKNSAAEPRHMTFEAQNFLLNKVTWLFILRLERCGDIYSSDRLGGITATKFVF